MNHIDDYYQATREFFDFPLYTLLSKQNQYVEVVSKNQDIPKQGVISFGSNDALGLAQYPSVIESACQAIKKFGASASSSVALNGYSILYPALEKSMSDFKGLKYTTLFLNAWMGMKALFEALCYRTISYFNDYPKRNVLILCDVNNHSCIVDTLKYVKGVYASAFTNKGLRVNVKFVRSCAPESLRKALKRYYKENTDIIYISDAVFSMDGTVLPLPNMLEVLAEYPEATVILDGAHATGCIGKTGRGILEHFDVRCSEWAARGINFVIMSTLSKFGASCGATISSNCEALNLLMEKSLYYTNTSAVAPPLLASGIEAIKLLRNNPSFVQVLQQKTAYARQKLGQVGFTLLGETNIIPVLVSDNACDTKKFSAYMLNHHQVWVSSVFHVASPRLRIVINRQHTYQDIDCLVLALKDTREKLCQERHVSSTEQKSELA